MSLRFFTFHERPELEQRERPLLEAWPAFMFEDPVAGERWHLLYERLGRFQYFLSRREARGKARPSRTCLGMGKVDEHAVPESGEYVVPGALELVTIDRNVDRGTYVEPNVWMVHPL